jgi:hypothetical protein
MTNKKQPADELDPVATELLKDFVRIYNKLNLVMPSEVGATVQPVVAAVLAVAVQVQDGAAEVTELRGEIAKLRKDLDSLLPEAGRGH